MSLETTRRVEVEEIQKCHAFVSLEPWHGEMDGTPLSENPKRNEQSNGKSFGAFYFFIWGFEWVDQTVKHHVDRSVILVIDGSHCGAPVNSAQSPRLNNDRLAVSQLTATLPRFSVTVRQIEFVETFLK